MEEVSTTTAPLLLLDDSVMVGSVGLLPLANEGSEALIDLASLQVIDGTVKPAVLKEALAWASQNVALLATNWKELNP